MPITVVNSYTYAQAVPVKIFTEAEMSTVLEITIEELRRFCDAGVYDFHLSPTDSGSGTPGHYQFTERSYRANVDRKAKADREARS